MIEKCYNCKHEDKSGSMFPCKDCIFENKWEPKEDKMDNEKTTKIDTEAELREQVEELHEELRQSNKEIDELKKVIHAREMELAGKYGMIDGLKFAIRCNGVSGGEVR